jgi:hypothetical protein
MHFLMSRSDSKSGMILKRGLVLALLTCAIAGVFPACGGDDSPASGLVTEHSGRNLGGWMKLYFQWIMSGTGAARDGDLMFMPLPDATDPDGDHVYTGELNVTLAKADGFVLPMYVYIGETYTGGNPVDDDPVNDTDAGYLGMTVVLTLDGKTLIDSKKEALTPYLFQAQYFDAPIMYPTPSDYGSSGAIWVKGIGFLHLPLPVGTHTLHLEEFNTTYTNGYSNTWNITVE